MPNMVYLDAIVDALLFDTGTGIHYTTVQVACTFEF